MTRQLLEVTDHGSGWGSELVRQLTAAGAVPLDAVDQDAIELKTISVVLRPSSGSGDAAPYLSVEVSGFGPNHGWSGGRLVSAADVPDLLLATVTRARLDMELVRPRLHGAALVDDEGRAVLLLGQSGSGKSTLSAHLAAAGLSLVNDEQVTCLSDYGRIAGFTRPIAIKHTGVDCMPAGVDARPGLGQRVALVTAEALGSGHRLSGCPALVVLLDRTDEDCEVSYEAVPPAQAVEQLCANNLDLVSRPVAGLGAFAWLATSAPTVRLRYRDASDAVAKVLAVLADPPPVPPIDWRITQELPDLADQPTPQASVSFMDSQSLRRRDGVVTVALGNESLLFDPSSRNLVSLNQEGSDLWSSLPWTGNLQTHGRDAAGSWHRFADDLTEAGMLCATPSPEATFLGRPKSETPKV